jgi:uncharacterized protein YukE
MAELKKMVSENGVNVDVSDNAFDALVGNMTRIEKTYNGDIDPSFVAAAMGLLSELHHIAIRLTDIAAELQHANGRADKKRKKRKKKGGEKR